MADKDLSLTITYKPEPPKATVAEDYSDRQKDQARQRLMANPDLNPQPEMATEEGPPEVPGRKAPEPRGAGEQPSPAGAGIEALTQSVSNGVKALMQGLGRIPEEPMQGARQALLEGLMPTIMAPLTAAFAVGGQGMENVSPEVANTELFDASTAAWLRTMLHGKAPKELTPEERKAFDKPMTVRDALETLGPMALPRVPMALKGAKTAVEGAKVTGSMLAEEMRLAPERGSIGPRPEPMGYTGAKPATAGGGAAAPPKTGEPAAAGQSPFQKPKPPEGAESRVNLGRIDATESVKGTLSDLNKFAAERLAEHRKVKGHKETVAESQASRWTLEQILTHEPEEILVDAPKALRLRDMAVAAAEYYDTLGKQAEGGDAAALAKLNEAFAVAVKLAALDEAQGRNLARGLEMRKEPATASRVAKSAGPDKILEISRKLGEAEPDPLMAYRRVAMLRPDQQRGFFRTVYDGFRAGRDIMHAAWINSLLSNPKTHTANLGATGLIIAGDIPETYVAGWVNRLFFRSPEGVQRAEATIKVRSLAEAYQDGIRLMGKAWKTGEEPFGQGPTTEHPRISAQAYGFSTDTTFGRAIDVMGSALNSKAMPTRGLLAEDAFMKGIAYRMEINALALRQALSENKEGAALKARVAELQQKPTSWMIEQAQDQATLLTLNRELGPAGKAFMSAANAVPLGRVLFPFLRTPGNGVKWVGQRAPGISLLSYQNWQDVMAGGAARDKAIARLVMGNAVGVAIAYEVSNGTITGGGPKNKNLAALQRDPNTSTKPPYSICPSWTDECYGYNRLDPVGAYVGFIADYVELASQIPDQDAYDEWAAYGETVVTALGKVSVNKTWLMGLSNLIDSIKDPNTQGGKLINSFASSIVPAGVRQLTREIDDNTIKEVQSLSDAIKSGLPFASGEVANKRNPITGERVQTPPGWIIGPLSPVPVTKKNTDPVFLEIQANEVSLPPVPSYLGGVKPAEGPQTDPQNGTPGKKLTPEQVQTLIDHQTQDRINGKTLYEALSALVQSERYQKQSSGPGGGRALFLRATYQQYMEHAKAKLQREDPELRQGVKEQKKKAIEKLLPTTNPKSPQYKGASELVESLTR